ncbi:Arc family DNA-binding protein [Jiella endophytica]|uniref:Arc family DNA-binding protein n=1 Tax=Jiella endophytica TaxID=2558362 RepID=A0A4Y8RFF0_9HYPH|nr:Arc family DNA-binding protein [Jiella endophytica]TFF20804.1 Arc family DNA-binding protein [Jiella endophytica]
MARKGNPSSNADQFQVRLPDGLRGRLKAAAAGNHRSMNSHIVAVLQASIEGAPALPIDLAKIIEKHIEAEVERRIRLARDTPEARS